MNNTAAKNVLAKILATENIMVRHDAKASTASFDLHKRVLTLPVWKNMTSSLMDMLIGHEVGHALYTPGMTPQQFIDFTKEIGKNMDLAKLVWNIVEDARIERMIKEEYPGLRRDFFHGYKEIYEMDMFEIEGKNINDLPFIDRMNLHFKIGPVLHNDVIFTPEEMVFVKRCEVTRTHDDIKVLSKDIYDFINDQNANVENQEQQTSEKFSLSEDGEASSLGDEKMESLSFNPNSGNNDGGESGDYVYNSSKTVTELSCTTPATPGTISGTANNNCGVSTKTYSIAAVAGATSYVWRTDIVGATLNGLTGNVTTTVPNVSLKFPANFVNAKVYVKAQNACGASAEKFKTLSSKPAVPTVITGPVNPCINATNVAYSISPVSGATSYSWTIPSTGMTRASGQGTTNRLVNTKATAVLCSLKVGSTNACGTGTKRVLPVTLVSCARSYELVHNGLYLLEQPRQIEIYTIDGRRVASFDQPQENTFTPQLSAGLYIFSLRYDDRTENQKVMVQ